MHDLKAAWSEKNYELVWTDDGSPSLSDSLELMHHKAGAYSESQLIYGNVLREALQQGARTALSVGLGLGYNEFIVAEELLKNEISDFQLDSLESETCLRESLIGFLNGEDEKRGAIYHEILKNFKRADIPQKLRAMQEDGTWQLRGALTPAQALPIRYQVIFFDAFSSKASPALWHEDFLDQFLKTAAAEKCFFSTYACRGSLKRALKKNNFELIVRDGYAGKRNSTLGVRGFKHKPEDLI